MGKYIGRVTYMVNDWNEVRKTNTMALIRTSLIGPNLSVKLIFRACSYGQNLSRLPKKHFAKSNNFVRFIWKHFIFPLWRKFFKCKHQVFPLSGKVGFIWNKIISVTEISPSCQQARSQYLGKLFVSYERNVTFHIIL